MLIMQANPLPTIMQFDPLPTIMHVDPLPTMLTFTELTLITWSWEGLVYVVLILLLG